jgi:predicted lipoprotein with Yx(FWY)xxD motif
MLFTFGLLFTIFLAACGFDSGGPTASNNAATPTAMANNQQMNATPTAMDQQMNATPTASMNGNQQMNATPTASMNGNQQMNATPTPDMGMNGDQNAFVHTTKVMINGKSVTVLTTAKGMILYYKLDDPAPNSNCTGQCAKDWPPLVAPDNMMTITSSMQLPKQLSTHMTGNGNQVEYDGHPLYTYASDMNPGQFTGRGMDNVWYLVGVNL